jgi:TolA-binding protein
VKGLRFAFFLGLTGLVGACATYRELPVEAPEERAQGVAVEEKPLPAPSARPPAPLPPPTSPALQADALRDFERARALFDSGREGEAILALTDFLRRYPGHLRAAEAQFLLAETHFGRREYDTALIEYRKVLKYNARTTERLADATIRAGECLLKLGKVEEARIEWEAVRRRFPASSAARRADEFLAGLPGGEG